jgi:ligand-binding sensor domain-containing protein
VAVDPNASSTVYAGTDRGVYGSVTGGRSWTPLFEGLPQAPVYAIVADPESPLELFAGTGAGLFHSYDAGGHWTPFPSLGAIPAGVASLWLDSERGELVLGTLGAGVYVIRLRGE